jgi:nicotinamidase-related amidase
MPARLPRLDRKTAAVLVVDIQERLTPVIWGYERLEKYAKAMIMAARELGLPVVCTEQYPKGLGPTMPAIREILPSAPLAKVHFSCGADPAVAKALEATGRKQVIVVGMETHVCVFQTARDLAAQGYEVHVCADAVSSRTEEHRRVALDLMRDSGIVVTSAETAIFDLLHQAGTPEFKRVSAFVK